MSTGAEHEYDVIVVGAGISGLSSAKLLQEQNVDVLVLEAQDRVGGRTYSVANDKCKYVDLGGAYIGPTQDRVLRLIQELGCELYVVNEKEDLVHYWKGFARKFRGSMPASMNPFVTIDMIHFFNKMDEYGSQIPLEAPWKTKRAKEWDSMTMAQWMDKEIWTKETRDFAEIFIRVLVTAETHEVSMLWFLWYVAQGCGVMRIISTTNGAQERKFVGGSQTLSNRMAALLEPNGRLIMNEPVLQVKQHESGVILTSANGNTYKAKYLVLANPPALHQKMVFDPPLPDLRNQLIQRVPMGSVIKCHVYYETAFWRENNMCGSSIICDKDALIGFTLDDTKPDGTYPGLIGFILADHARELSSKPKEERLMAIAKLFSSVFKSDKALHPIHYEEKNWMEEQWSGGCYTATMPPGVLSNYGRVMRESIGRMYFAGTETATSWSGYMDGAVQAGERAAREVMYAMGQIGKDEIWQDEPVNGEIFPKPFDSTFVERHCPSIPMILWTGGIAAVSAATGIYIWKYQPDFSVWKIPDTLAKLTSF